MSINRFRRLAGAGVLVAATTLAAGVVQVLVTPTAHAATGNSGAPTIIALDFANGMGPSAGPTCVAGKPGSLGGVDWCFGATYLGGKAAYGSIWRARPDGSRFASIGAFDLMNGLEPSQSPVINEARTTLYGVTSQGGSSGIGVVYAYDLTAPASTNPLTAIASFSPTAGGTPQAPPILVGDTLFGITGQNGAHSGGTVWSMDTKNPSAGIRVLHSFVADSTTDVAIPFGALVSNPKDGMLYGMAFNGGAQGLGGIFSLRPDGSDYTLRSSFTVQTGGAPQMGALIVGRDGALYANTWIKAANGGGALVKFDPATNSVTPVFAYNTVTGLSPYNSPAESASGKYLYTVTWRGNSAKGGNGALVAIEKATGKATNLFVFDGTRTGGRSFANPTVSPHGDRIITQLSTGGPHSLGTVFSIPIPKTFR